MKVIEDIYALDTTKGTYAYVILGPDVMLVDTGLPFQRRRMIQELLSLGITAESIRHILLTHHDADHIGNAAYFQSLSKASVWVSQEDRPYIEGAIKRPGIKRWISMGVRGPEHLTSYGTNQRIGEVEMIPTPGHTPGHVCLLYKDVLFAGDLVANRKGKWEISPAIMTWDQKALIESIRNVATHSFHWICPAHGKPVVRGADWECFVEEAIGV